jgi:hypothetical protein
MGGRTAHHANACREFPGSTAADAPLTSRQAAVCFEVVRQSEFHIDFRGGDLHESHVVHTIYPKREEDPELDAKAEAMALACGLQYNLVANPSDPHSQGGSGDGALMGEAMKIGVCSIVSECGLGYLTQPRDEFVENHVVATINAMKHVGACPVCARAHACTHNACGCSVPTGASHVMRGACIMQCEFDASRLTRHGYIPSVCGISYHHIIMWHAQE